MYDRDIKDSENASRTAEISQKYIISAKEGMKDKRDNGV